MKPEDVLNKIPILSPAAKYNLNYVCKSYLSWLECFKTVIVFPPTIRNDLVITFFMFPCLVFLTHTCISSLFISLSLINWFILPKQWISISHLCLAVFYLSLSSSWYLSLFLFSSLYLSLSFSDSLSLSLLLSLSIFLSFSFYVLPHTSIAHWQSIGGQDLYFNINLLSLNPDVISLTFIFTLNEKLNISLMFNQNYHCQRK